MKKSLTYFINRVSTSTTSGSNSLEDRQNLLSDLIWVCHSFVNYFAISLQDVRAVSPAESMNLIIVNADKCLKVGNWVSFDQVCLRRAIFGLGSLGSYMA